MNDECNRLKEDCSKDLSIIKSTISDNPFSSNNRFLIDFMIIRACSTIEKIFKLIIHNFLADSVKPETERFLSKRIIDSSCNPSAGIMENILADIDSIKKEQFCDWLQENNQRNIKGDLNSLVTLRNNLAHCNENTSGASINIVERYFNSGIEVLDFLDYILSEEA